MDINCILRQRWTQRQRWSNTDWDRDEHRDTEMDTETAVD